MNKIEIGGRLYDGIRAPAADVNCVQLDAQGRAVLCCPKCMAERFGPPARTPQELEVAVQGLGLLQMLLAENERLRPVWTDATPTKPGLYWHRKRPGKVPSVVLVEEGDGGHLINDLDERIDGKGGQWAPAVGPAEPKQI